MGEVKRVYCDGCQAEIVPVTYTQGDDRGVVTNNIAVWKQRGSASEGRQAVLCPTCYDKVMAWLKKKQDAADVAWSVEIPTTKAVAPPTL